jgi:hypothetical protein
MNIINIYRLRHLGIISFKDDEEFQRLNNKWFTDTSISNYQYSKNLEDYQVNKIREVFMKLLGK